MNKIKLGNDFSEDGENQDIQDQESKGDQTEDNESEEETENSADSPDSENQEEVPEEDESEETEDESESEEETEESEEETSEEGEEPVAEEESEDKKTSKVDILQGFLDTEEELDSELTGIDKEIFDAKKRVFQKRKDRRLKRELVRDIDSRFPEEDEEELIDDDLSDIDEDTLKILDKYTRAKGLVPKSELKRMTYQEKHKAAQKEFYDKHPEYDLDDRILIAIKKELKTYSAPEDPNEIPGLFEKAHREVMRIFPGKFKTKSSVTEKDKQKSVRLKTSRLGSGSGGSGGGNITQKSSTTSKRTYSQREIQAFRDGGWTEKEIKELIS